MFRKYVNSFSDSILVIALMHLKTEIWSVGCRRVTGKSFACGWLNILGYIFESVACFFRVFSQWLVPSLCERTMVREISACSYMKNSVVAGFEAGKPNPWPVCAIMSSSELMWLWALYMSIGKVMRNRYITDHRQISFTCDTIFDLRMFSNGFGFFFFLWC